MRRLFEGIAASLISFTRIPVPFPLATESFQDATWHIPLIGWLNAAVLTLTWQYLPVPLDLKFVLVLLLPVIISGGMHEDGLADAADGLFGGQSPERRLAIMKEPQVGSFGVLALILYILAYYLALKNISTFSMMSAICVAFPLARLQGPILAAWLPYVRPDAGSKANAYLGSHRLMILWSLIWVLPVAFFVPTLGFGLALLGSFILVTVSAGLLFKSKLGGITGDCLGAAIKISEIVLLWTFALQFSS
ncbi:MAG: adenosylcobinamide-GDP ribazoletransferase [Oligoflexus sp.]|nr:adenosylcobinamide-GDP ribazoletransferase [Oligoflexus sp.]